MWHAYYRIFGVYTDWFRSIAIPFKHVCEPNQTNRRRNISLWYECKNTMISTNMIRGTCNMNDGCIYESVAKTHKFHLRCTDRQKSRCQIIPRPLNNMQNLECLHLICVKQIKSNTQIAHFARRATNCFWAYREVWCRRLWAGQFYGRSLGQIVGEQGKGYNWLIGDAIIENAGIL